MNHTDWRLTRQEKLLQGATLYWKKYKPHNSKWEHDRCGFCWSEFRPQGYADALTEGYATADNHYWICGRCFNDFKDMFHWTLGRE